MPNVRDKEKDGRLFPLWKNIWTEKQRKECREEIVRQLASEGATQEDIATYLNISQGTVSTAYRKAYFQGRIGMKMSIRKWQFLKARMKDSGMIIRLGSIYCKDQREIAPEGLVAGDIKKGIDDICGNSVQNKSISSKIPPTDSTSPSDQSGQENP